MEARKEQNSYLMTSNIKHFPIRTFVVTPREMLDIIERSEGNNEEFPGLRKASMATLVQHVNPLADGGTNSKNAARKGGVFRGRLLDS